MDDRQARRSSIEATDFVTQGLTVRWHLTARLPDPGAPGGEATERTQVVARLGCDGRIVEVWSTPLM